MQNYYQEEIIKNLSIFNINFVFIYKYCTRVDAYGTLKFAKRKQKGNLGAHSIYFYIQLGTSDTPIFEIYCFKDTKLEHFL